MYDVERLDEITKIIKEKKSISCQKLADIINVSISTIRRDLLTLERQGLIKRTFGGAIIKESTSEESSIFAREKVATSSKKIIATLCSHYIQNNQSIFLDSSSTVQTLGQILSEYKYLTIVTNGLNISSYLSQNSTHQIFLSGGKVQTQSNSVVGSLAANFVSSLHCDLSILSCSGLDISSGVTESSIDNSFIKMTMLKQSDIAILLCDSTKFGKKYLSKTCDLEDLDIIITDVKPEQEFIDYCKNHKVTLIY